MQYLNMGKYAFFTVNTMKQGDKKVDLGGEGEFKHMYPYVYCMTLNPSIPPCHWQKADAVATCWEELFASSEMRYTVTMPLNDKWIQVGSTNLPD